MPLKYSKKFSSTEYTKIVSSKNFIRQYIEYQRVSPINFHTFGKIADKFQIILWQFFNQKTYSKIVFCPSATIFQKQRTPFDILGFESSVDVGRCRLVDFCICSNSGWWFSSGLLTSCLLFSNLIPNFGQQKVMKKFTKILKTLILFHLV